MLWDTAGQEEFDAITKAYYRGGYVERVKGQKCELSHSAPHMPVVAGDSTSILCGGRPTWGY
jgi:hypothetical protein